MKSKLILCSLLIFSIFICDLQANENLDSSLANKPTTPSPQRYGFFYIELTEIAVFEHAGATLSMPTLGIGYRAHKGYHGFDVCAFPLCFKLFSSYLQTS
jgi:hypothetical protein